MLSRPHNCTSDHPAKMAHRVGGIAALMILYFWLVGAPTIAPASGVMLASPDYKQAAKAAVPNCTLQFSDVPDGSTFYDFVQCLACQGIVNGYADGTFRPNNNVTRGQLSKIVANTVGLSDPPGAPMFEDVPLGSTFYDFVNRLAAPGIVGGYPCGGAGEPCVAPGHLPYFRPNANATRGQISKIVSNAVALADPPGVPIFEDVPTGSTFYDWIQRLASRGVMSGYPCGATGEPCVAPQNRPYFRPSANATRGQTVKIVTNACGACSTAQEMIGKALGGGRIDAGTALLFRAFALHGDPRLEREYWGESSFGEDHGLEREYIVISNTISPDLRALIEPFIVRPDDPISIYNVATPTPEGGFVASAKTGGSASSPEGGYACSERGWTNSLSPAGHFKVWAKCPAGASEPDPDTINVITTTAEIADQSWGPMTALMGTPVPDEVAGPQTDVYVVKPLDESVMRDGRPHAITEGTLASAPSAPPRIGVTSSGYMLVSRARVRDPKFKLDFVHEFFHILQAAHNDKISFQGTGANTREYWFVEASAEWAAVHFERVIGWSPPARLDGKHYPRFITFQKDDASLHASQPGLDLHLYAAYIWPFFMEQEGGAQAIRTAWNGIAGANTDWTTANNAIDAVLRFDEAFHEFAVRNLNRTFEGQNLINRRYVYLDSEFPDEEYENIPFDSIFMGPEQRTNFESVKSLQAKYYSLHFTTDVKQVKLDFSNLFPNDDLDVDAIIKKRTTGQWELRRLPRSGEVTLCDVEAAWLILSNHNKDLSSPIQGELSIDAQDAPCSCNNIAQYFDDVWTADLSYSYEGSGTQQVGTETRFARVEHSSSISTQFLTGTMGQFNGVWNLGNVSINDESVITDGMNEDRSTIIGSGVPVQTNPGNPTLYLGIDLDQCRYNVFSQSDGMASIDGEPEQAIMVGNVEMLAIPIEGGLPLAGSRSVPVTFTSSGTAHYFPGGMGSVLYTILGMPEVMGYTTVTWNFRPMPTPTPGVPK
jgi:hypothetical protein